MIRSLFDAGVDMFRLNFSHGQQTITRSGLSGQGCRADVGRPIGIMVDLQGPKCVWICRRPYRAQLRRSVQARLETAPGDGKRASLRIRRFRGLIPVPICCSMTASCVLKSWNVAGATPKRASRSRQIVERKGVNVPGVSAAVAFTEKDRCDLISGSNRGRLGRAFVCAKSGRHRRGTDLDRLTRIHHAKWKTAAIDISMQSSHWQMASWSRA